jgi:hypothetical protein
MYGVCLLIGTLFRDLSVGYERNTKTLSNKDRNMSNYAHNIAQLGRDYDRRSSFDRICLNLKLRVEWTGVMEV